MKKEKKIREVAGCERNDTSKSVRIDPSPFARAHTQESRERWQTRKAGCVAKMPRGNRRIIVWEPQRQDNDG